MQTDDEHDRLAAWEDADDVLPTESSAIQDRRGRGRPRARQMMAIMPFIPPDFLIQPGGDTPAPAGDAVIAGQFSPHTRRAYAGDVQLFMNYLDAIGRPGLAQVTRDDLIAYRAWLIATYAPATVNRRLSVVRSLFKEALLRGEVALDPTVHLRQLRVDDESPTIPLDQREVRTFLDAIDRTTLLGLRDAALLSLLIRTGLRRAEITTLATGDLAMQRGHHTLTVLGKGHKRRLVKVPVDVARDLQAWLEARTTIERQHVESFTLPNDAPLFVEVRRVGRGEECHYRAVGQHGLTGDAIWYIVKRHLSPAGISTNITPHSLRHTFITLALEGHAPLHKVQYAAGHADPRTTERYHHRKDNLDDNATDYIKI